MPGNSSPEDAILVKRKKRLRMCLYTSLLFIVVSVGMFVVLGLTRHAHDLEYNGLQSTFEGPSVVFELVFIAADPKEGTITLDWRIIGQANSSCSHANLSACRDVNIFFDNNLLRTNVAGNGAEVLTNDRPTQPIFRFNATTFAQRDELANTPAFRTVLALFSSFASKSSLLYYPFDRYMAEIFMFAQDAETSERVGIVLGKTRGVAAGFQTSAFLDPDATSDLPGIMDIVMVLERGNMLRTYSIIVTVAVWIITIILLLVMFASVFFRFRQKGEILVLPVATLFAFTQLRASMPGAPEGFGDILDFVGILPCLTLLSVSAAVTLAAFILSDPTEHEHQLTWGVLRSWFAK